METQDVVGRIVARLSERMHVAVQHATSKRRRDDNGAAVSCPVSSAMLKVVAQEALAALQTTPGGGSPEAVAAVRRATKKFKATHSYWLSPMFWLHVGLVPPEFVSSKAFRWSALLDEPLTVLGGGEDRVALLGDRVVWRHVPVPTAGDGNTWYGNTWYIKGGSYGVVRFDYGRNIGPAWDPQGFTLAQWALVWRYLACFGMFAGGPLTDTVTALLAPGLPCRAARATLMGGILDPTWATLQEVGDWLTHHQVPARLWWVVLAAGYRPRKIPPHRQLTKSHAAMLLADRMRWKCPPVSDMVLDLRMLWAFSIMHQPTQGVGMPSWTAARHAWSV
jgi:hypothetical protein